MHRNGSGKKQGSFHSNRFVVPGGPETQVCQFHIFPDNPEKPLPKTSVCMVL